MRIFDNVNMLPRSIILRRLQALDATADCNPYKHVNVDPEAGLVGQTTYYVGVESTLTDAQIEACLVPMTQADVDAEAVESQRQAVLKTIREKYAEVVRHIKALEVAAHAIRPAFVPEEWE